MDSWRCQHHGPGYTNFKFSAKIASALLQTLQLAVLRIQHKQHYTTVHTVLQQAMGGLHGCRTLLYFTRVHATPQCCCAFSMRYMPFTEQDQFCNFCNQTNAEAGKMYSMQICTCAIELAALHRPGL
jgi:hypothetical protein